MSKKYVPMFTWDKDISPEYKKLKLTSKCPRCGYFHWSFQLVRSDGTKVKPSLKTERDVFFECKKCQYRIPVCVPPSSDETKHTIASNLLILTTPRPNLSLPHCSSQRSLRALR